MCWNNKPEKEKTKQLLQASDNEIYFGKGDCYAVAKTELYYIVLSTTKCETPARHGSSYLHDQSREYCHHRRMQVTSIEDLAPYPCW